MKKLEISPFDIHTGLVTQLKNHLDSKLTEAGFDMNRPIETWKDPVTGNQIFRQEIQKEADGSRGQNEMQQEVRLLGLHEKETL